MGNQFHPQARAVHAGTYIRDAYSFNIRLAEKRGTTDRMDSFAI